MIIFVYGTLLKGLERWSALSSSKYLGPALIKARLFDLGSYPGITSGDDDVVGEIYEINESTLTELDAIEGYTESTPESSLYLRKPVAARKIADDSEVNVETYFYPRPNERTISGMDYRAFRLTQANADEQWVIAYGSNISSRRINKRFSENGVALAETYIKGVLPEYELVLNKQAYNNNSVYANIRYQDGADGCPAVAWRLSSEQVSVIDACEGAPRHYLKVGIPFRPDSGGEHLALCYIAHPDKIIGGGKAREHYLDLIKHGYKEMGWSWEI